MLSHCDSVYFDPCYVFFTFPCFISFVKTKFLSSSNKNKYTNAFGFEYIISPWAVLLQQLIGDSPVESLQTNDCGRRSIQMIYTYKRKYHTIKRIVYREKSIQSSVTNDYSCQINVVDGKVKT